MDVVYICRDGDNEELRYSLRSVVKNLPHSNVWVVGGKPDWYTGNHIPVKQQSNKYANGRANLRAIAECGDISDEFVFMNDDFFIVQPVTEVPYYHGGDLIDKIRAFEGFAANSKYVQMLWDTVHILSYHGSPTSLDYAIHVPMRMRREELRPLLVYEASIRTLYGNLFRVGGTEISDVKVHTRPRHALDHFDYLTNDLPFLSTHDRTFPQVRKALLKREFAEPSPFE